MLFQVLLQSSLSQCLREQKSPNKGHRNVRDEALGPSAVQFSRSGFATGDIGQCIMGAGGSAEQVLMQMQLVTSGEGAHAVPLGGQQVTILRAG